VYHIQGMPKEARNPSIQYMTRIVNAFHTTTRDGEVVFIMHLEFLGTKTEHCAFTVQVPDGEYVGTRK
jgi:hypothetical protein